MFTLRRITQEFRPLYVKHMLDEFRGAQNKKALFQQFLSSEWDDLQLLLSDSKAYLRKYI